MTTKPEDNIQEAEFTEVAGTPDEAPMTPEEMDKYEDAMKDEDVADETAPVQPPAQLRVRVHMTGDLPAIDVAYSDLNEHQFQDFVKMQMEGNKLGGYFVGNAFVQDSKVHYFEQLT